MNAFVSLTKGLKKSLFEFVGNAHSCVNDLNHQRPWLLLEILRWLRNIGNSN